MGNGMPGPQNGGNIMDANNNVVGNGGGGPDEGNRWTHQVQQLWRHHAYLNGNMWFGTTGNYLFLGQGFIGVSRRRRTTVAEKDAGPGTFTLRARGTFR